MSRSSSSFTRSPNSNYSQSASGFKQNGSVASKWLGPLAGLALGGVLASLFMGHGMGQGIMTWLAIGALFLLIRQFLRNRNQPRPEANHYNLNQAPFARDANTFNAQNSFSNESSFKQPVHFDESAFLREAKVMFNRLQAAYDQKNMEDLRKFTTPEVLAEAQLQLQERGNEENHTDIIQLNADLLDIQNESQRVANIDMQGAVASVRFSGLIQENRNEPAASFNEVWHFKKDAGASWKVAGIEQS